MPVQYVLQATSIEKLEKILPEFLNKVYDNPTFQMADVDLKFSSPEVRVNINRDKAGTMGVNVRDVAETLQYGLSGQRMGYFYMNGKQTASNVISQQTSNLFTSVTMQEK